MHDAGIKPCKPGVDPIQVFLRKEFLKYIIAAAENIC
jgi:hypothetical protein